jgi:hypothetical protein
VAFCMAAVSTSTVAPTGWHESFCSVSVSEDSAAYVLVPSLLVG